ncbi:glycosyltransferase [Rubrivivax gelatinosus]|uniref:Glycosyl transferase, group 1 n=1 Tax=Rubrivivax gelatinosus (strain NBRC 100245 / IL144) TaxID=983917 RepID=I0HL94_RUBGI|nr:glycosyltransferase [Rubrivivax gelatinosus]BAL93781.1 glycosyl transferase, group 1 [Rubrivivax gelatinosus IL144]
MRLLHLFHHGDLLNGVDRTTLTLLSVLQRGGHEVFAVVPNAGEVTAALERAGIEHRIAALGCCASTAPSAQYAFLRRGSARTQQLVDWIREWRADAVHLNTGHLLDGAIAAARAGVPAIWHIHAPIEVDHERYARLFGVAAYGWLLGELGARVVAVSDDVRASLQAWVRADRLATLFNGVDVDALETAAASLASSDLRAECGWPADARLVLGVGRISAQKDFAAFARVAHRVLESAPDTVFAIAGPAEDAALAAELTAMAGASALQGRLKVLGPRSDVPALLAQADAFMSTAVFEGHPIAVLEAMAMRRPVVAMACVGLRECLQHDVDSLMVPPGDEAGAAEAVCRVLSDRVRAGQLGSRGRENVIARFSAQSFAAGFASLAAEAVAGFVPGSNAAAAELVDGLLRAVGDVGQELDEARRPSRLWTLRNRLFGARG